MHAYGSTFPDCPIEALRSTALALSVLPHGRGGLFLRLVDMAKRLSDYPWVKVFWSEILADTAGMSGDEFRAHFLSAHKSWIRDDYDALPDWAKASADYIRCISKVRVNTSEHKLAQASISEHKPMSSPLSSSLSSPFEEEDLKKEDPLGEGKKEKKSDIPKPAWVESYEAYLAEAEPHFDRLMADWKWVEEKKEYHRGALIAKTVERMWFEFWGTKAGWENKKTKCWDRARRCWRVPDWDATITANLKRNLVYLAKGERDEEADWVERGRLNAKRAQTTG